MNRCKEKFESHIRSLDGDYNLLMVGEVYIDVETQIEWRTWQKAWQAALASQKPADDGWIDWEGGDCPVSVNSLVNVRYRNGGEDLGSRPAKVYNWSHNDKECYPIIAYRVVKP